VEFVVFCERKRKKKKKKKGAPVIVAISRDSVSEKKKKKGRFSTSTKKRRGSLAKTFDAAAHKHVRGGGKKGGWERTGLGPTNEGKKDNSADGPPTTSFV